MDKVKFSFALAGIVLFAIAGWLIGALLEHTPSPGGFQAIIALIGATVAVGILALGEALKAEGTSNR
jgi:uncharacterized membrane protein YeaQ/YmgE (transglycosylase-associated protein family)